MAGTRRPVSSFEVIQHGRSYMHDMMTDEIHSNDREHIIGLSCVTGHGYLLFCSNLRYQTSVEMLELRRKKSWKLQNPKAYAAAKLKFTAKLECDLPVLSPT